MARACFCVSFLLLSWMTSECAAQVLAMSMSNKRLQKREEKPGTPNKESYWTTAVQQVASVLLWKWRTNAMRLRGLPLTITIIITVTITTHRTARTVYRFSLYLLVPGTLQAESSLPSTINRPYHHIRRHLLFPIFSYRLPGLWYYGQNIEELYLRSKVPQRTNAPPTYYRRP